MPSDVFIAQVINQPVPIMDRSTRPPEKFAKYRCSCFRIEEKPTYCITLEDDGSGVSLTVLSFTSNGTLAVDCNVLEPKLASS